MKKALLIFALLLLPTSAFTAGATGILFCETFSDDWQPVKQGREFTTNSVSLIISMGKPIGATQILMSIYKVTGDEEKLLQRHNVDINPSWDIVGVRKLDLPEDGVYNIVLSTQDGTTLKGGKIRISTSPKDNANDKQKASGNGVENLFRKYAPKQE